MLYICSVLKYFLMPVHALEQAIKPSGNHSHCACWHVGDVEN